MPPPPHHLDSCDRGMALGRWCPTVIANVGCATEIPATIHRPNDDGNGTKAHRSPSVIFARMAPTAADLLHHRPSAITARSSTRTAGRTTPCSWTWTGGQCVPSAA